MEVWQAVVLAIVEGLTEFLPISSTGHIIIASYFMEIQDSEFTKNYTIIVQFGAILSVIVLYWRYFLSNKKLLPILLLSFVPTGVVGFLLHKQIDLLLGNVVVVSFALILGGIFLLFFERMLFGKPTVESVALVEVNPTTKPQCNVD